MCYVPTEKLQVILDSYKANNLDTFDPTQYKAVIQPAQEKILKVDELQLAASETTSAGNMKAWKQQITEAKEYEGTELTMIYHFNVVFNILLAIQSTVGVFSNMLQMNKLRVGVLCIGSLYTPPVHITLAIMTFFFARSDEVDKCLENNIIYQDNGNSFIDDI